MENQQLLFHDNAPAHRSILVKYFLAKNNVKTPEHPSYSRDLAQYDSYLFPRLKSALKVRHFCDTVDVMNATEELKKLSQNDFPKMFSTPLQSLSEVDCCTGVYLEGNVAEVIVLFVFLRNNVIPGTF